MALFTKFELPPNAKAANVEKVVSATSRHSQVSQLSQTNKTENGHKPPSQRKSSDMWLVNLPEITWRCRRCHPPAPGAEKIF